MPNINLYEVYNRKRAKFGINDSANFQQYFTDALNIVYSEFNEKVFEAATLEPISSFDDIIDNRLSAFSTITFDSDCDDAIQGREYWSIELEFERTSAVNGFTETIADDASNVVVSIANNVFSIVGDTVQASGQLPEADLYKIVFESSSEGNSITVNDDIIELTYTTGDADTSQAIGEIDSHVISATSGYEFLHTRFLTAGSVVYEFLVNEGAATLVDEVASYEATVVGGQWDARYIEPTTSLDFRYRSALEMGLDYHLQDGGQFGLEPEPERERKWYGRGIRSARETYSQQTTYISPLNISGA